ncbi:CCDC85 [Dermatophagoides farinae]|uniref:CCDC85 n=1 Tax=Dermatophagoides farinae TaxID=6954 RepID=A0A922L3K0_DERFA|nr:CCDC85 [Dermatophagoides farinae]
MDKRDEEILELKQKLIDLMKENNEMKELILFLDDERNYARQFVRQFNSKQSMNWNSLKQKLNYLEQKQFELVKENLSLKQLCVLLDENSNLTENELKSRGVSMQRPKYVHDIIKLNSLRNCETNGHESSTTATNNNNPMMTTSEEKSIIYSLSETAIKSIVFNGNGNHRMQ